MEAPFWPPRLLGDVDVGADPAKLVKDEDYQEFIKEHPQFKRVPLQAKEERKHEDSYDSFERKNFGESIFEVQETCHLPCFSDFEVCKNRGRGLSLLGAIKPVEETGPINLPEVIV